MTIRPPYGPIEITVQSRTDMDFQLESAVRILKGHAQQIRDRGILVTRHSAQSFTVEMHSSVPFGMTFEKQRW